MRHKVLAIDRHEQLEMISELERFYRDLGASSKLSVRRLKQLQKLRRQVEGARSPPQRRKAHWVAEKMLKRAADDVMTLWIESQVCFKPTYLRDDCRRMRQVPSSRSWAFAA